MTAPAAGAASWPDLLDALEERNRRTEGVLRGADGLPPEVDLQADGALPQELRLRAELVLAQTRRLERLLSGRGQTVRRARHYGAA